MNLGLNYIVFLRSISRHLRIILEAKSNNLKKVILGIGSSGPTTRWGYDNFASLIKKLNQLGDYYFYLLL